MTLIVKIDYDLFYHSFNHYICQQHQIMKIRQLHIKNINQFKDLRIDLTYPDGHEKAGKALDKVCFIGQSGTGKTTLLEIIEDMMPMVVGNQCYLKNSRSCIRYDYEINREPFNIILQKKSKGEIDRGQVFSAGPSEKEPLEKLNEHYKVSETFVIYYPEGFKHNECSSSTNSIATTGSPQRIYDYSQHNIKKFWDFIVKEVEDYDAKLVLKTRELYLATKEKTQKKREEEFKQLTRWENDNPNPLKILADECLDPILKKFHLKVSTDLNIDKIKGSTHIPIQHLTSNYEIPYTGLSAATQNIIYSAMPLYYLKPTDAIILYDEIENSLYPDVQQMIIDYYVNLAPKCQFFFATHSPIIASSFDPWEIVELKFDDHGNVYQELYYAKEKERHVNNYTIHPKYLNWSGILMKVFDLKQAGNEAYRTEALTEAVRLEAMLKKFKEEGKQNSPKAKKAKQDFEKVASKLAWELNDEIY